MAIEVFMIPLENIPQRFAIELGGMPLIVESRWNGEMPAWELSLFDAATSAPLIASLPLVSGVDLLSQHAHLGLAGQLRVVTDGDQLLPPTLGNLGIEAHLYYITGTI